MHIEWDMKKSEDVMQYFDDMMSERGLLRHRVGHGWTGKVLGARNTAGWEVEENELADEVRPYIAEINSKRELFGGSPVNTNLCLSNPKALELFAEYVVKYITTHHDTEYLHVWLADEYNNSCECSECRKLRPADHYIALLNYLDDVLTKKDINVKLCFLMYTDTLWAPIKNKLINKERFLFMFAPISRSFQISYKDIKTLPDAPVFELNKMQLPKDLSSNLALLKGWQEQIECDSFVYDYHMGRAHHSDPTHINISRLIYDDLHSHKGMGMNGICSCQELRVSFPNALANYVMGQASLNLERSFDEICSEYYMAAYGQSGVELFELMAELSNLFKMDYFKFSVDYDAEMVPNMQKVPPVLLKIKKLKENHAETYSDIKEKMWKVLDYFVEYTAVFAEMIMIRESRDKQKLDEFFNNKFTEVLKKGERYDQAMLDVMRHLMILRYTVFG